MTSNRYRCFVPISPLFAKKPGRLAQILEDHGAAIIMIVSNGIYVDLYGNDQVDALQKLQARVAVTAEGG